MKVVFLPKFRNEVLYGCIERGDDASEDEKEGWVGAAHFVEERWQQIFSQVLSSAECYGNETDEDDGGHPYGTAACECVEHLGDRVIGGCALQQFLFGNPSHCVLIACHFHPDGINAVAYQWLDGCYDNDIALVHFAGVVHHVSFAWNKSERVCFDEKVEVLGIMVCETKYQ